MKASAIVFVADGVFRVAGVPCRLSKDILFRMLRQIISMT